MSVRVLGNYSFNPTLLGIDPNSHKCESVAPRPAGVGVVAVASVPTDFAWDLAR